MGAARLRPYSTADDVSLGPIAFDKVATVVPTAIPHDILARAGLDDMQFARVPPPRFYLLCGLPGAGKTTRAKELVASTGALHLSPDEWLVAMGISLVDYPTRFRLQDHMLLHAEQLLTAGLSVIVEFGSWSRTEREAIRAVAVRTGATTELHFLDAPLPELVQRVRARGGPDADVLVNKVLLEYSGKFDRPAADETALYDRYVGPAAGPLS